VDDALYESLCEALPGDALFLVQGVGLYGGPPLYNVPLYPGWQQRGQAEILAAADERALALVLQRGDLGWTFVLCGRHYGWLKPEHVAAVHTAGERG